jgi:NADH:ubiquinone oxidoreductase subunit K
MQTYSILENLLSALIYSWQYFDSTNILDYLLTVDIFVNSANMTYTLLTTHMVSIFSQCRDMFMIIVDGAGTILIEVVFETAVLCKPVHLSQEKNI